MDFQFSNQNEWPTKASIRADSEQIGEQSALEKPKQMTSKMARTAT